MKKIIDANITKITIIICLYLLIGNISCAYLSYIKDPFVDIPNFNKVDDILYRGGQPTEGGLRKLDNIGIKTIINLSNENKKVNMEKEIASKLGVNLINIPLNVYQAPTDDEVLRFLSIVTDKEKQPVFVHCESGRDRTGAMVAMYRVVVSGWTIKQAYNEAKRLGFWPYHGDAELKKFIHQLKDKEIYFKSIGRNIPLEVPILFITYFTSGYCNPISSFWLKL